MNIFELQSSAKTFWEKRRNEATLDKTEKK